MGVPPAVVREHSKVGGICLGTSKPRSLRLMSLQAMLNSIRVILPSASVSARPLEERIRELELLSVDTGRDGLLTKSGPAPMAEAETAGRSREPVLR